MLSTYIDFLIKMEIKVLMGRGSVRIDVKHSDLSLRRICTGATPVSPTYTPGFARDLSSRSGMEMITLVKKSFYITRIRKSGPPSSSLYHWLVG